MAIITVDPNELLLNFDSDDLNQRFSNSTPQYENMTPYVEFFAIRKNVLVNYLSNDSISSDSFERIDLLGFDTTEDGEKVFTVRYLDVDPLNPSNGAKEAFGIKNIEIKTNASYVPTVDITFIDVKGMSYFSQNGNTSYGVLLDFPPPLFVLRIKGVFGLMVEYRLHLTKTNVTFNSNNANYEIKCNFVGYNIAPFTDISTGLLTSVHFISPDLNGDIKLEPNDSPRSFFELLLRGDILYNKLDTYKNNSTDLKDLTKYDDNLSRVSDLNNKIVFLSNSNNFIESFNTPDNNNLKYVSINDNEIENYIDIRLDYSQINVSENQRISKLIEKYFKDNIQSIIEEFKDFGITSSDLNFISPSDQPIGTSLKDLLVPKNTTNDTFSLTTPIEELNTKYYQLNYGTFNEKVTKKENELKDKKNKLKNKIQTNIGDIADIDVFNPTIKNIVEIVTKDVDRFFKLMVEAANKKKNSIAGVMGNLRFPEYNEIKTVGGVSQSVKIYPGSKKEFSDWGEVQLVESIIAGLSRAQKTIERLDELQKIENGDSKWVPIIPFESKSENITQNEYFNKRLNVGNLFENINKRYCVAKNYTYKGYLDNSDILDFVARSEARNLLYAINNEEIILQKLNNFSTDYQEADINKFLGFIPANSIYNKSNVLIQNLSVNNISLKPKITTTQSNVLNQDFNGLSIVDKTEVISFSEIDNENKIAELIDTVKELTVPFLKKFTGVAKIEMCNDNVLVFLDSLKINTNDKFFTIKPNIIIGGDYEDYTSDFFISPDFTLTLMVKIIFEQLNKKDKQLLMVEFFLNIAKNNYLQGFYDESNLTYKFFFAGLIEIPKIYFLYLGYLLKNSITIKNDTSIPNDVKVFSEKLNTSLTDIDKNKFITYYDNFIVEHPILLDEDFYKNYPSSSDKDILINSYIDSEDVELMDRFYLMNASPLTFGIFTPNNINIPRTFSIVNNSKNFNSTQQEFRTMNINDQIDRSYLNIFFNEIRKQIQSINKQKESEKNSIKSNFQDNDIKAQLYYQLKNLYDRWLSIPENAEQSLNLYQELFGSNLSNSFKYVDRAMNTTAQDAVMDYSDFIEDGKDFNINLYTLLTRFFSKNNFLFWPLQASLVFDPKNDTEVWKNSFKLITDNVNALKSKPTFVCMFINSFSSNLDLDSKYYPNDGLSFLSTYSSKNELDNNISKETLPADYNSSPNNIYVFIVSFGKQNQSIFGNLQLSTTEFNDTYESLKLTDLISKKNADTNPMSKGQNLFNVMAQRSYSVTVEVPLGNMTIQPTMYFELVGVPMFNGGYIITEVEHTMNADRNKLKTRFKGTRVGKIGLEMITDSKVYYSNVLDLDVEIKEQLNTGPIDPNTFSIYKSMSDLKI